MVGENAGGVDEEAFGVAVPFDDVAEYAFRHGGTADVAEADEKD